jgi:hypothetical protein
MGLLDAGCVEVPLSERPARLGEAHTTPFRPCSQPQLAAVDVEYSVVEMVPNVKQLRGSCRAERLKYEVEYGLKRGTTDNSYLVQVSKAPALPRSGLPHTQAMPG